MLSSVGLLVVLGFLGNAEAQNNIGRFWHVTDFHYDHTYWTDGLSCNDVVNNPGQYGDYWCDSPWRLVQDSITNMAAIDSDVDFILWTGDNVAHIKDDNISLAINIEILQNITDALSASFPNVPVYATLGNHDFWPSDQANISESKIYVDVSDMWADWISNRTRVELFREGGYYMAMPSSKLRVLALNTNLYYSRNHLVDESMEDPAGQFAWMRRHLEEARANGEKVIITGHVTPGLLTPGLVDWFYEVFQTKFVNMMTEFADIILALHFGHDHIDSFKLLQNADGTKAVPQFTAPSVTPWRYKIPDETGDPHNPGIRIVEYDRDTGRQLDYHQYYINLTDSNTQGRTNWTKLHSFRDSYDVDDMTVASLRKIFSRWEEGKSTEYFTKYCNYRLVSKFDQICTDEMKSEIYCGGLHHGLDKANDCKKEYLKVYNAAPTLAIGFNMMISAVIVVTGYVIMLH